MGICEAEGFDAPSLFFFKNWHFQDTALLFFTNLPKFLSLASEKFSRHSNSAGVYRWDIITQWLTALNHNICMGMQMPIRSNNYSTKQSHSLFLVLTSQVPFTVHSESIQTPSLFPHFVTLQPYFKMD